MIDPSTLQNRATPAAALTPRQAQALELVGRYTDVAGEPPSFSWLARRLGVSRPSAFGLVERARERRARADMATRRAY